MIFAVNIKKYNENLIFLIELINYAYAGVISDAPRVSSILLNVLNFLLSIAGLLVIIMLVISGGMYVFSAGDRKMIMKAKKSAKYSVLGIIVILGGMVVIRFLASTIGGSE